MSSISKTGLICLLILIVAAAVFLCFRWMGWSFRPSRSGIPYANAKIYSTWDKFLSSKKKRVGKEAGARKVVFIGMDGATWNVFDSMIDAGELPTFQRLKMEGSYGILRSDACYVSPPAWVSMFTGMRPEHTGIYTFGRWDKAKREFITYSSDDVTVPSVWDIASLAGEKVAVTNMAMTYPAHEVNGIMVTGMLTPIMLDDRRPTFLMQCFPFEGDFVKAVNMHSFSQPLRATFSFYTNTAILLLYDSTDDGVKNYDSGVVTIVPSKVAREKGAEVVYHRFKLDRYSPWLQVDYPKKGKRREAWCQIKVDTKRLLKDEACEVKVSALYCSPDNPDIRYTYPPDFGSVMKREFKYYFPYTPFDRDQIKDFVKDAARYASFFYEYDDWDLFMYTFYSTDHAQHVFGDGEPTKEVYRTIDRFLGQLLNRLSENDVLMIASDHGFAGYKYSIDLNSYFSQLGLLKWNDEGEIDHDSTLVFYNMWTVYFNHSLLTAEELAKRGIEIPNGSTPQEALIQFLREKGKALTNPETGQSMPLQYVTVPENAVNTPPDLIVTGTYPGYLVEFWDRKNPHRGLVRELKDDENWNHERDGVYFIWGKGVKQGFDTGVKDIVDIAPTMLYAMDLPLSRDLDGRVILDAFTRDGLSHHPVALVRKYAEFPKRTEIPESARESLEKKLKSLGYIR